MAGKTPKFDFLIEYVLALLEENNIILDDEQKKMYVPQILAQVELRLGLQMLSKLNEGQKKQFSELLDNPKTSPEQWNRFWHDSIPTFDAEVKSVLLAFAEKVKTIMSQ